MSLPRGVYWWVEDENGELITLGREKDYTDGRIWAGGAPNIGWYRRDVLPLCREGERPVKVRIVKEERT